MSDPGATGAAVAAAAARPQADSGGDSGCALRVHPGAVEKTGQGVAAERLRAQSYWLFTAPPEVQGGFPRVHSFEWGPDEARLVMERVPMEPLSARILDGRCGGDAAWAALEGALDWADRVLYARWRPSERLGYRLLVEQVRGRARWTSDTAAFHALVQSPLVAVNGEPMRGLLDALTAINERAAEIRQLGHDREHLVHGDLHTGNLLVGADGGFRLIDPRGDFVGGGPYFDRSYDVGKVLHDLHAGYTLLRAGRFTLGQQELCAYTLRLTRDRAWEAYRHLLGGLVRWGSERWGGSDPGWLARGVLAEGLLLAGLLPFHSARPRRAAALLLAGLVLIDRWIRWADGELPLTAVLGPLDERP